MTIAVEKNPPVKLPNEPAITPQVVAEHGLAPDEYERLLKIMGRTPTMVELGYKDFISDTFQGFMAPAKTPPAIVELLSVKSIEILKRPAIAEQLRNNGFEVIANGPGGMRKRIDDEVPKWRDIVAKAGIKPV